MQKKEVIENSWFSGEITRFIHRDDVNEPQDGTGERPGLREPWKPLWRPPRTFSPHPPPLPSPSRRALNSSRCPTRHQGGGTGSSILGRIQLNSVQSRETPGLAWTAPKRGSLPKKATGRLGSASRGKLRQGADWGRRHPPRLRCPSPPASVFPARTSRTTGPAHLDLNPSWLRKVHPSLASALTIHNVRLRAKPNTHLIKLRERMETQLAPAPLPRGIAHAHDDSKRL